MAQNVQFKLNRAGAKEFLNSAPVRALVDSVGEDVAAKVRASVPEDVLVECDSFTTDRPIASVAIKHPGGKGFQLKRGALTRAAAAVGLEVRPK